MMEGAERYRKPMTEEEERLLLANTVPKNTGYNTTWAVKVFEDWQGCRKDKTATSIAVV